MMDKTNKNYRRLRRVINSVSILLYASIVYFICLITGASKNILIAIICLAVVGSIAELIFNKYPARSGFWIFPCFDHWFEDDQFGDQATESRELQSNNDKKD